MIGLILAGGKGTRVSDLTRLPKPLLPLAGKPAIGHIVDEFRRHRVQEIFIVVPDMVTYSKIHTALGFPRDVYPLFQDKPLGPGHAIICAAAKMSPKFSTPVVVACSDTVFRVDELSTRSTVYTAPAPLDEDPTRWCYVDCNAEWHDAIKFIDKPTRRPKTRQVNIGLYVFGSQNKLKDACEREWIAYQKMDDDSEIQISDIIAAYGMEDFVAEPVQEWLDTGTPKSFMKARKRRFVSRAFNHLELRRGMVAKKSSNRTKLSEEYDWYKEVEKRLPSRVPSDIRFDADLSMLTMGYIPYNTVSDYYLFTYTDPKTFVKFLFDVRDTISFDFMGKLDYPLAKSVNQKTDDRMEYAPPAARFLWDEFRTRVRDSMLRIKPLAVFQHGDLNLTNILAPEDLSDWVVVDPHGVKFGDWRYDMAKLAHSLYGYDHVINGLYDIRKNHCFPHFTDNQLKIQEEFKNQLMVKCAERSIDYAEVYTVMGSLFLSMVPLHAESPERQRAFISLAKRTWEDIWHYTDTKEHLI